MPFYFEDQVLDPTRRELPRRGKAVIVEPRVFDLRIYLIENRDRLVTKDAPILDSVSQCSSSTQRRAHTCGQNVSIAIAVISLRFKGTSKNSDTYPALSAKQRMRSVRASFLLFAGRFASCTCPTGAL